MSVSSSRPLIPLPHPSAETQPFWDGCARGELLVQQCRDCGTYVFVPEAACTNCFSTQLDWTRSSGKGTVYTFSTMYRVPSPAFESPHTVASIKMDEGYFMLSNLVDIDPDEIEIGMPVEVTFERVTDEITLPKFRPDLGEA